MIQLSFRHFQMAAVTATAAVMAVSAPATLGSGAAVRPTVIYQTGVETRPADGVVLPNLTGLSGVPSEGLILSTLSRPSVSPDGSFWALRAALSTVPEEITSVNNDVIIVGRLLPDASGAKGIGGPVSGQGRIVVQKGDEHPNLDDVILSPEPINAPTFNQSFGQFVSVNDAGDVAFQTFMQQSITVRLRGTFIYNYDTGYVATALQSGGPVPGFDPDTSSFNQGLSAGAADVPTLNNAGELGFLASQFAPNHPGNGRAIIFGDQVLAEFPVAGAIGVTAPTGDMDAPVDEDGNVITRLYGAFPQATPASLSFSADGSSFLADAVIQGGNAASRNITVVDNNIVLQTGVPVPTPVEGTVSFGGETYTPGDVRLRSRGKMVADGSWAVQGFAFLEDGDGLVSEDFEMSFVLGSSGLLMRSGDLLTPDSTIRWDADLVTTGTNIFGNPFTSRNTAIETFAINANGDFVVAGRGVDEDGNADLYLVWNGEFVALTGSTRVDLTGNGGPNNAFISGISELILTDDNMLYMLAGLRNSAGDSLGTAFMFMAIPEPASLAVFGLAGLGLLRRRR